MPEARAQGAAHFGGQRRSLPPGARHQVSAAITARLALTKSKAALAALALMMNPPSAGPSVR